MTIKVSSPCYLVGVHEWAFRPGEAAEILRVVMVTPEPNEPRPCFEVRYKDGKIDYVPLSELESAYAIVSSAVNLENFNEH